jgi:hypothetical protein
MSSSDKCLSVCRTASPLAPAQTVTVDHYVHVFRFLYVFPASTYTLYVVTRSPLIKGASITQFYHGMSRAST